MREVAYLSQVGRRDVGGYIQLDGLGIVSGLRFSPCKQNTYQIICIDEDGIHVRGYRAKRTSVIPPFNFRQGARIWTIGEHRGMTEWPAT